MKIRWAFGFLLLISVASFSSSVKAQNNQLQIAITPACNAQSLAPFAGNPYYKLYMDYLGNLCTNGTGGGGGGSVTQGTVPWVIFPSGTTGTPTQSTVTCGTGSTTLLAAAAAAEFVLIKVPAAAANPVWINVAGSAAVAAPPSEDLGVGSSQMWSAIGGFLPTSQMNCIAAVSTAVTLIYK